VKEAGACSEAEYFIRILCSERLLFVNARGSRTVVH
jgi:hypothetical protein